MHRGEEPGSSSASKECSSYTCAFCEKEVASKYQRIKICGKSKESIVSKVEKFAEMELLGIDFDVERILENLPERDCYLCNPCHKQLLRWDTLVSQLETVRLSLQENVSRFLNKPMSETVRPSADPPTAGFTPKRRKLAKGVSPRVTVSNYITKLVLIGMDI